MWDLIRRISVADGAKIPRPGTKVKVVSMTGITGRDRLVLLDNGLKYSVDKIIPPPLPPNYVPTNQDPTPEDLQKISTTARTQADILALRSAHRSAMCTYRKRMRECTIPVLWDPLAEQKEADARQASA
jgi:hypothetical protein